MLLEYALKFMLPSPCSSSPEISASPSPLLLLVIQSAHNIELQDFISRLIAVRTYATKHDRWCEKNDLQQAAIALINARIKREGKNSALCIRK